MPQQTTPCPECGTLNRKGNATCRLCDALLKPAGSVDKPRIRKKILRRTDFIAASRANQTATRRLITLLLAIAAVLGYLAGWSLQVGTGHRPLSADSIFFFSSWGMLASFILLALSLLWTWFAFKRGDRIVMKITGAQLADRQHEAQLYNVVDEMAIAAGISTPSVYIIETEAMNAFATGMSPTTASLAVTRGLLNKLNREELQAVIGHEMGHVVNWDIRYATAVSVLVGLIVLLSDGFLRGSLYGGGLGRGRGGHKTDNSATAILFIVMLVFAILAPLIARLVQMAVSRQREFLADATSVRLTRNTYAMISALEKLSQETVLFDRANRATQHLFIVNPLRNFSEKASSLMATHPPITRRIQRLYNLGDKDY